MAAQVRSSPLGGLGLFATKPFAVGDVILEEHALVTLAPQSKDDQEELVEKLLVNKKADKSWKPQKSSLWNAIETPSTIPKLSQGQFRGMVQAGLIFDYNIRKEGGVEKKELEEKLLKLYHPTPKQEPSSHEERIIQLSNEALDYIKQHSKNELSASDEVLRQVMLIWASNAFEGGRIYDTTSRVNHSCNPNAIIQVGTQQTLESGTDPAQKLVAAVPIAEGDEISISYLGLLLYSETSVRRDLLQQQKSFVCDCPRCQKMDGDKEDKTARIPCPNCHPRQGPSQILEEDVQYDDEQAVNYVTMSTPCEKCKATPEATSGTKAMKRLQKVTSTVTKKVVFYLQDHHETSSRKSDKGGSNNGDDDDDDMDVDMDGQEMLEEYVSLASTVMGAQHWTTNLLLLLHLDRRLSQLSQAALLTQQLPSLEDIAEAIDILERVLRFFQGVNLKLQIGHVLADVIIGVARILVSLGDEKSQKYATEWLDKLGDYVSLFETEGRKKVVDALRLRPNP